MNALIASVVHVRHCLRSVLSDLSSLFPRNHGMPDFAFDGVVKQNSPLGWKSVLQDILGDGFLYAVPKTRRSIETRLKRRSSKWYVPQKNIIVCEKCGHYHPVHAVCGNCYETIKEETQIMQAAIVEKLRLKPIDKEVVILYQNDPRPPTLIEGKQIVELPKERPPWFCKNLLSKDSGTNAALPKSLGPPQEPPIVKD